MFRSEVRQAVLRQVVDAVSIIVSEGKFKVNQDGLSIKSVDPTHVAMVDLKLDSSAFESFEVGDHELGVDVEKLKNVLRLASPGDVVSLYLDEDSNRLVLNLGNLVRSMALLDTRHMPDPKIPDIELPATVVMDGEELERGIRAAENVSDHVIISVDGESFQLRAEGDTDSMTLKVPKDLLLDLKCDKKVRSIFALSYFSNMIRASRSSNVVRMGLGSDYPIKMEFDIADGKGHVLYLLAPRIPG
jgi:proliferating cell nuclear antigen